MNLVELAQRLRRLRVERGLTLEEVASRGGLTRGWLSKVENFRVTPSLPALHSIANGLGVTLSELFDGLDARPPLAIIRRDDRLHLRRDEDVSQLSYESLAHRRPSRSMDPFIITVPKSKPRPRLAHPGEEFMLVLKGELLLEHGEQSNILHEGDSAYFDGIVPHSVSCNAGDFAQILTVYYGNERGEADGASDREYAGSTLTTRSEPAPR
jgi:transcriptional regulator with XRE-family HTH domain